MDFREFYYVMKVASKQNISKAAAELYISQPSLSQYINSVEDSLHTKLFDRTTHPITLTPAGEIYVSYAKSILELHDSMMSAISTASVNKSGRIKIACSNFRSFCILPQLIAGFNKNYPSIKIDLYEAEKLQYEAMVLNGDVDFAIYSGEVKNLTLIDQFFLCREELLLILPPNHPHNKKYAAKNSLSAPLDIDLKELKNDNFILLQKNQDSYRKTIDICAQFGFFPKIILQTPLYISSYALAMAGIGNAFIPSSYFNSVENSHYGYAYRISRLYPQRNIYLIKRKAGKTTNSQEALIDYISKHGLTNRYLP